MQPICFGTAFFFARSALDDGHGHRRMANDDGQTDPYLYFI